MSSALVKKAQKKNNIFGRAILSGETSLENIVCWKILQRLPD